ncbi:hypothetical protein ABZX64_26810 [Streptomyces misionensis]|uniref:hypothetical protein n=1 Tax=Streptomyces misionensis TaxID=67331 RepID=UPI0033BFA971
MDRVRAVSCRPEFHTDAGAYARGWEACRAAVDRALADPDTIAADEDSRPFSDLSRSGLLWLINPSLLHPSGLALTLHTDGFGHVTGWSLVRSPDGEPWQFSDDIDADGERRARATLDAALHTGPESVRTEEDDRPDMGGIVLWPLDAGENGCELTSADIGRTVSKYRSPDSPVTGRSGSRFEYRARVPRGLAGAAFAEGFAALRREMDAHEPQPVDEPRAGLAELVQPDQNTQVSEPDQTDEEPLRLLHLVHGTVPAHEHLALQRRNADLAAALGDVLARFTIQAAIGGHGIRTAYLPSKTVEEWRQVLAGATRTGR